MKVKIIMQNVARGYNVEWFHNNQIIAYTLEYASVATLENWTIQAIEEIANWPKTRPYLALHDLSQPGVGLLYITATNYDIYNIAVTPGAKRQIESIIEPYPDWKIALALVVSTSLSGQLAKLNMAAGEGVLSRRTQAKAFFGRDEAISWLMKMELNTVD
jgi:hypothetical protein